MDGQDGATPQRTTRNDGKNVPGARVALRRAVPADAPAIWTLIREFAAFERMSDLATGTPERLAAHLAGEAQPRIDAFLAEDGAEPVGYAIFLPGFSTFWTRPLLWLEDLFVRESHRGLGVGRALLAAVAREAVACGSPRLDWAVLEWNRKAIGFYERMGARRHGGWQGFRLEGEALERLVAGGGGGEPGARPDFK